jgi:hypothetical protein
MVARICGAASEGVMSASRWRRTARAVRAMKASTGRKPMGYTNTP